MIISYNDHELMRTYACYPRASKQHNCNQLGEICAMLIHAEHSLVNIMHSSTPGVAVVWKPMKYDMVSPVRLCSRSLDLSDMS